MSPTNRPARAQTSIAQFVRNDSSTKTVMSPVPVEKSFEASVVASRDQILPLALVDFQNPALVDLTCAELLARFTPNTTDAIFEVWQDAYTCKWRRYCGEYSTRVCSRK